MLSQSATYGHEQHLWSLILATRSANVKGIVFHDGMAGSLNGGYAVVHFDLLGTAFTGGVDTITLGGGGYDQGVATTSTLVAIMQNRRRDGKTVVLTGAAGQWEQGLQAGVSLCPQAAAVSGSNVASITLNTAPTGGSSQSSTSATWDRAAAIVVSFYTSNSM